MIMCDQAYVPFYTATCNQKLLDFQHDSILYSEITMDADAQLTLTPAQLRRLRIFAEMSDEEIATFIGLLEPVQVKVGRIIVKMHDNGDCMYLLLDGDVRVSQMVDGRETMLAELATGDFFGEFCLVNETPRAADVVAKRDCRLLKITKSAFAKLMAEHPDITTKFLFAILHTLATRLRNMDRKFVDSMLLSRHWGKEKPAGSLPSAPGLPPHRTG